MIKAGIIGVGYWGPNLLRNLVANESIEVKWMCDLDTTRLGKFSRLYPAVKPTNDYREILNDPQVDLVVIATPVHTHFQLGMKALQADKNLLITKPLTVSERESLYLIEEANARKKMLMVDHTYVYHPAVAAIKEMIAQKQLGDLLYYQSSRMNLGLYQPDISVIYDLMPHDLSILNELVPFDPVEISVSSKSAARLPQPDIAFMHLNYESDFIATIQASWLSPSKVRQTILTGRKKMVLYDDVDVVQKIKVFDKGVETLQKPEDKEKVYTDLIQYRHGDVYSPAIPTTEALKIEVDHMVHCLETGRTPRTGGLQALRVVRLLEHADTLARSNKCWMALPFEPIAAESEAVLMELPEPVAN